MSAVSAVPDLSSTSSSSLTDLQFLIRSLSHVEHKAAVRGHAVVGVGAGKVERKAAWKLLLP